jgi:hypothetical protein
MNTPSPEEQLTNQILEVVWKHTNDLPNPERLRDDIAKVLKDAEVNSAFVSLASTKMNFVQGG